MRTELAEHEQTGVAWESRADALRDVCLMWGQMVRMGWTFAVVLRTAVSTFCRTPDEKADFLSAVSAQTNVSIKRLQNILAIAGNESALMARDYELELGHGDALAKVKDTEEAESWARMAAENQWTVAELRAAMRGDEERNQEGKLLTLELDPRTTDDDWSALIVAFVNEYRGAEGLVNLAKWIEDVLDPD